MLRLPRNAYGSLRFIRPQIWPRLSRRLGERATPFCPNSQRANVQPSSQFRVPFEPAPFKPALVRSTVLAGTLLLLTHCATPPSPTPLHSGEEVGTASWYGPGFQGNLTASGERFDMNQLTAAHKTLPFGTLVEVLSLTTHRKVKVRINDRGPFVQGRIIDLSYGAARRLRMIGKGTDRVRLTVLNSSAPRGIGHRFFIQVGSFQERAQARALRNHLLTSYPSARIVVAELPTGRWFRVQLGDFSTEKQARALADQLEAAYGVDPIIKEM